MFDEPRGCVILAGSGWAQENECLVCTEVSFRVVNVCKLFCKI